MGRMVLAFIGVLCLATAVGAQERLEFHRMFAHWDGYSDPEYVKFIREARPEVVQVGFYGAHFWSLAHTPAGKGYPAHFPVVGLEECGQWFANLNKELHQEKVKIVGHFNVEFLVGDPDSAQGPRGFFKFYKELWDEKLLGPRPVRDPMELLEKNADGSPIVNKSYSIGGMQEYWGCLNNPHWRSVLKAWVKVGIQRGVDGFISNYYYRHNCLCPHCQKNFRNYLGERFKAEELQTHFEIKDLKNHQFTEIVGWHSPKESTLLRREMLRFSQISCKEAYDEVFVKHGRSLKKDLILAQWNHLGDFNQISGDERCLLPKELWGRDEDYTWYSTGSSAFFTDLEAGILGEGTLQARYIRGAFQGKPFTLGKYEGTRTRVYIAELAANGGAPMGFYARFKDPVARQEIIRYYHFLEKHANLYRGQRSHAEVALLFPRLAVHRGDLEPLQNFKKWGKELLDQHVLFDVLPDDVITWRDFPRYKAVLRPEKSAYQLPKDLSQVQAPTTVRVSANRSKDGDLVMHLVNYNRQEPAKKRSAGRGIVDENPIAVEGIMVDLALPKNFHPGEIHFLNPEGEAASLKGQVEAGRLRVQVPQFLVYGVLKIQGTHKDGNK
jgi:hypothetical protein